VGCIEEYLTKRMVLYWRIDSESQNDRNMFVVSVQVLNYHGPMTLLCMSCKPWFEHDMISCLQQCDCIVANLILVLLFGRSNMFLHIV
jgi:hypothetical protein